MTQKLFYLTPNELQFHAKNPSNFGLLPALDFLSGEHNPSCGDSVLIGGCVQDGKITKLCFQGSGCVISMAMASKLTLLVVGMNLDQIKKLDEQVVEQVLGLRLGLNRIKCGLLPLVALKQGVLIYQQPKV